MSELEAARGRTSHTTEGSSVPPVGPSGQEAFLLAAIVDSSEDAIISKTLDGRVTSWNRAAERIFGYSAEEMVGQSISTLIPESRRVEEAFILARVSRGERVDHFATVRRRKDGTEIDISVTISPIRDGAGRIIGASKISRDVSAQNRLAQELHASEGRFRDLTQSLPQLVWSCRGDGSCDYLSPQWVAYTGLPELDQLGYGWLDQIHPDDRSSTDEGWNEAAVHGTVYDQEFRIRRHDGVYRWFKTRATPLRDDEGRVVRWFGTNTDVQDLRDAQETLARLNEELEAHVVARTRELVSANERARVATLAARMGVWEWNIETDTLVWDETMFALYGVTPGGSLPYAVWRDSLHPEDAEPTEEWVNDAVSGTREFVLAFRIVLPDGTTRHLRAAATVQRDPAGKPLSMVGVNVDVTHEREVELALAANEAQLREFVRHAPASIAMLDRDLRYLRTSEQWLRDFHMEGESIVGRSHYEVFTEGAVDRKALLQRVLGGAVERGEEVWFTRPDGTGDWLQWEARPWRTGAGEIAGAMLFVQLITARKEMELRLGRQKDELVRSNRDLEQFAYAASHDLQEPLRAVSGCAQILERSYRGKLDASADQLIEHIVDGADRMRTLIHDLLAYSRVATHGVHITLADSGAALQRAIGNLSVAIGESHATIEVGPMPCVWADVGQLTQLFQNLLGNALKYCGTSPPRVEVSAEHLGGEWVISVRDWGIGIEPSYFERIFVLFQRLHTRNEYPGTGIGLALCQKIVERHGGRIWVESALGVGATFRFALRDREAGS